jgi:phage baseplate assembly protein gpV
VPIKLYESTTGTDKEQVAGANVVSGVVVNNCDLINEGKVLVRIPSLDQEVWARLTAIGGGSDAGFLYNPRVDDEVLVAVSEGGTGNAYVLGGLWKRVLKTGLKGGLGHEVEFDDAQQSIKITSSTKQKITIEPTKIELTNTAGTLTITLDNTSQQIDIKGVNINIEAAAMLTLKGRRVTLKSEPLPLSISSTSSCSISGTPINLN